MTDINVETLIWPSFDVNSEKSRVLIEIKQANEIDFWTRMRECLADDVANLPMARFRLWASLALIPIVTRNRNAFLMKEGLTAHFSDDVYKYALQENWVGLPEHMEPMFHMFDDIDTSSQRLNNVAHLWVNKYKTSDIRNYKRIVEIGGGYGDMCSVIHDLGFEGEYVIFDFPEVQAIQKYYLGKQDITPTFITETKQIEPADLVIGTWSISEIPLEQREEVINNLRGTPNWLVAYQERAFNGKLDNTTYFKDNFPSGEFNLMYEHPYDGKNMYMSIRG